MTKEPPQTIGDMRRKAIVTDREIAAAVEAFLADPKAAPFEFGSGHTLDVGTAVDEHRPAKAALADRGTSDTFRRTMIRTAVILSTPTMK